MAYKNKILGKLAVGQDVIQGYKSIIEFKNSIKDFSDNIVAHNDDPQLQGEVARIYTEIFKKTIPQLSEQGSDLTAKIDKLIKEMQTVANSMVQFLAVISNEASKRIDDVVLKAAVEDVEKALKELQQNVMPATDKYAQTVNQLVSELSSEKNAIDQSDKKLDSEIRAIKEKIEAETNSFEGIMSSAWKELIGKLDDENAEYGREMAKLRLQLRWNAVTEGCAVKMQKQAKAEAGKISDQIRYWDSFNSLLSSLKSDLNTLKEEVNSDSWPMEYKLVQSDWFAIEVLK